MKPYDSSWLLEINLVILEENYSLNFIAAVAGKFSVFMLPPDWACLSLGACALAWRRRPFDLSEGSGVQGYLCI